MPADSPARVFLYGCPEVEGTFGVTPPLPGGLVHTSLATEDPLATHGHDQSLGGLI